MQDSGTDESQFRLFLPIVLNQSQLLVRGVYLLLHIWENPLGAPAVPEDVLIDHLEQVIFLTGQLGAGLSHGLHEDGHVRALSLLSQLAFWIPLLSLVSRLHAGLVGFQDQDTEDREGKASKVWAPIGYGGVLLKRTSHLCSHFDLHLALAEDPPGGKGQAMAYTPFSTGPFASKSWLTHRKIPLPLSLLHLQTQRVLSMYLPPWGSCSWPFWSRVSILGVKSMITENSNLIYLKVV